MIASVAITCAARTITFTPDTSAAWRSYAEANTMPLYLPAADSPIERGVRQRVQDGLHSFGGHAGRGGALCEDERLRDLRGVPILPQEAW